MLHIQPEKSATSELSLPDISTCFNGCLEEAIKAVSRQEVSHALVGSSLSPRKLASFERIKNALLSLEPIDYCRKEDFEQSVVTRLAGTGATEAEITELIDHVFERVKVFEDGTNSRARIWLRSVPSIQEKPFDTVRDRNFPLHFDFDDKHRDRTRLLETLAGEFGTYFVDPNVVPYSRDWVIKTVTSLRRYISWMAESDGREALADLSDPHLPLCKELERLGLAVEEVEVGISFIFTGKIVHSGGLNYDSSRLLLIIDEEI